MHYKITKGLDIQMAGAAVPQVAEFPKTKLFYVHPSDFKYFTPRLYVKEGDVVEVGTPLFHDKSDERIHVVSPVAGTVREIVRGEKRAIRAIVIEAGEQPITCQHIEFNDPQSPEDYKALLLQYGLWPMLRQRPYSAIPNPDVKPKAVFVSCFDSAPLASDYAFMLKGREEDFRNGAAVLKMVAQAPVHFSMREQADNTLFESVPDVEKHYFSGPHPTGNVGTQIHRIAPILKGEMVWYVSPLALATIGHLFAQHELCFERMVALTGPSVRTPQYMCMPYGADLSTLLQDQITTANARKISGNVLTGITLDEYPSVRFYDHQITVMEEGGKREILGWLLPGLKKWSLSHTFLSWLTPKRKYAFNTSLHGGRRTFMMTDVYDKVFPFELMPLQILRACAIKDIEQMEALGIYEVDPEDFALCEVVCPSKIECQTIVDDAMQTLQKENN